MSKLFLLIGILYFQPLYAGLGDTLHSTPFQRVLITTDPSKGVNKFTQWGNFPSSDFKYRKVLLNVIFQCPDSLHCGEWDYTGTISLKNRGIQKEDWEIARMMTPYGWSFPSNWKFTWQTDITDFGPFIHDSIEVEYAHYGYENNKDRGWLVTFDFQFIEGVPVQETKGIEKLWSGDLKYGDSLTSIESYLQPITLKNPFKATNGRLRIIQTGHGMDSKETCAEFCPKLRKIYHNSTLIDQRKVWKKCGTNALYPQAGTWIYDRANWCPGSLVSAESFELDLKNQSEFTLNIDMEEYRNNLNNPAHYTFSTFTFLQDEPWAKNDVSIDQIIQPNSTDEFARLNPICANPVVRIKNNGKQNLKKLTIHYGLIGDKELFYNWKGNLKFNDTTSIQLPSFTTTKASASRFFVTLSKPNNSKDEYNLDNSACTPFILPEKLPTRFVIEIQSNDSSKYLTFAIKDAERKIKFERKLSEFKPATLYRDTILLDEGCYEFLFKDTLNVGLDFWAMPEAGYGFIRFFDMNGNLIKNYKSDFGSFEYLQFITTNETISPVNEEFPLATIFPRSNNGKFLLDYLGKISETVTFRIEEPISKETVYTTSLTNLKSGYLPFDVSHLKEGRYFLYIKNGSTEIKRSFRIRK